jgi:acetyl esterase/lipase
VVFLHGGGYIREISAVHWQFAAQLARDVPAVVDVPLYPLAPSATAGTTVPLIADLVHDIALTHGGPVALVGDSAGGGLAFAAAVVLRDTQRSSVSNLVLFSPWLDLTLSDPRLVDLDRQDLTIGIAGGREAARMYSGELALDDPLASPLLGRVDGLPPIDVFAGTHDLISVDSVRLQQRCEAVDQTCRLRLVDEMPHVFPILPLLREAACARAEVVDLLRR